MLSLAPRYCLKLLALAGFLTFAPFAVYAGIGIELKSDAPGNTYVNAGDIYIEAKHDAAADDAVLWHWQDYRGRRLTASQPLAAGKATVIKAPQGKVPTYIGLVFTPADPEAVIEDRDPGEAKEYGFAVFEGVKRRKPKADPAQWMGVVHADLEDPWLGGWMKSMTWRTTSAKWWSFEMQKRRKAGYVELPIVSSGPWKWDDNKSIPREQLNELRKKAREHLSADKKTLYWETGIEENLGSRFEKPYYFTNLKQKSDIIRAEADRAKGDIKLIFQIANMRYEDLGVFMKSAASRNYDIIALHPYNWPDFPAPEDWLDDFLAKVRAEMAAVGRDLPLWITEIGAPHQGNNPGKFFGYPKKKKSVRGMSYPEMVSYMVKFHVMSYQAGVEKVFWYNYKDRGPDRDYAEDHFGLIDHWGYPKPAYVAYAHLYRSVADKYEVEKIRDGDIWAYKFSGASGDVIVAWLHPEARRTVVLEMLDIAEQDNVIKVTNALGDSVKTEPGVIGLTDEPVFIYLQAQ